ncbi:MAG: hypothetical protein ACI8WB_000721 [Phenylobacterium sp.]|jgi:hypothetical protein
MQYINAEIGFYFTMFSNIAYAVLFVYHFVKKKTNKSLMILAGCLCLSMVFAHVVLGYIGALDKTSAMYKEYFHNYFSMWVLLNSAIVLSVFMIHKLLKVEPHYVVRYIYRCLVITIILNAVMHVDVVVMGHREANGLWTLYSISENILAAFMFFSLLIARKWSEVFKWLQLAHSH